jgi:hypothetical protein
MVWGTNSYPKSAANRDSRFSHHGNQAPFTIVTIRWPGYRSGNQTEFLLAKLDRYFPSSDRTTYKVR